MSEAFRSVDTLDPTFLDPDILDPEDFDPVSLDPKGLDPDNADPEDLFTVHSNCLLAEASFFVLPLSQHGLSSHELLSRTNALQQVFRLFSYFETKEKRKRRNHLSCKSEFYPVSFSV